MATSSARRRPGQAPGSSRATAFASARPPPQLLARLPGRSSSGAPAPPFLKSDAASLAAGSRGSATIRWGPRPSPWCVRGGPPAAAATAARENGPPTSPPCREQPLFGSVWSVFRRAPRSVVVGQGKDDDPRTKRPSFCRRIILLTRPTSSPPAGRPPCAGPPDLEGSQRHHVKAAVSSCWCRATIPLLDAGAAVAMMQA